MDWLSAAMSSRKPFALGEVTVTFEADEAVIAGPVTVPGRPVQVVDGPEALRRLLRLADDGAYRPMAGARGIRGNWSVRVPIADVRACLDEIYPLATDHIRMDAEGTLRVVSLSDVLDRQSGRYAAAAKATPVQRDAVATALCSECVRVPVWAGLARAEGDIPCPEACSFFVALCRAIVLDPDSATRTITRGEPDASVAFADFEHPANRLAASARQTLMA